MNVTMRKATTVMPTQVIRSVAVALLVATAGLLLASPAHAQSPSEGPGGPVLVAVDPGDHFGDYYAEILRSDLNQ
jgi:hypothetical protein